MTPSLQEYDITTWKDKFLLIFKNSSIAAGYLRCPRKLKDLNLLYEIMKVRKYVFETY